MADLIDQKAVDGDKHSQIEQGSGQQRIHQADCKGRQQETDTQQCGEIESFSGIFGCQAQYSGEKCHSCAKRRAHPIKEYQLSAAV